MKKQLEYLTHIFRKITARLKNADYQALFLRLKSHSFWLKVYEYLKSFRLKYLVGSQKQTIFVGLGLLYLLFLVLPFPQSVFFQTKQKIYDGNNSSVLHTNLSEYFLGVYNYAAAKKELALAMATQPGPEIEKKLAKVSIWETKPETLTKELVSWQTISQEKPLYRDGFFQEAVILYQLKRLSEAKVALKKVFLLDPNFEAALKLDQLVKLVPNKVEGLD